MKIALLGYGKMGKAVDRVAQEHGHTIVSRSEKEGIQDADVCIDFSHPDAVLRHIGWACEFKKDIVIGTTGWEGHLVAAKKLIEDSGVGGVHSPNFSVSTHLFSQLIHQAGHLFSSIGGYDVAGYELHHREKGDSPSGTACMLAEDLCDAFCNKEKPEYERVESEIMPDSLHFASVRCGSIPGTHTIMFDSPYDTIELTLRARSRDGWALGAIMAAEWVHGKKGFYTMRQMLEQQEAASV